MGAERTIDEPRGPRALLTTLGWRALVFAAAIVALELWLRAEGYGRWVKTERDAELGWVMLPDQRGWSRDLTIEERINSYGFRDREWEEPERLPDGTWARDPDELRIAVLGNSMTYGTSVAIERTWPRVLEDLLRAELERRGDPREPLVMNFAVQGYLFDMMVRNYERNVRRFRPDVVVVAHHLLDVIPMPPSWDEVDYRYRRLFVRSALHDFLNRKVTGKWIPRPRPPFPVDNDEINRLKAALFANPWQASTNYVWAAAGERMRELHAMVEEDGGRLVVVVLPLIEHMLEPEKRDTWEFWARWEHARAQAGTGSPVTVLAPLPRFREAQEPLNRVLRERGVPADERGMKVLPPGYPERERSLYLHTDLGHYSVWGHRLLAEEVARGLAEADLLAPASE